MKRKFLQSLYTGTLFGQWEAIITLQQLIILADDDGVVRNTPKSISIHTGIPLKIIRTGLDELQEPDRYAREKFHRDGYVRCLNDEGWMWFLPGFEYYARGGRPPSGEWARLRSEVFERDNYTCQYCGQRGGELECDHVHPVSKGGSNHTENLVAACKACNREKRAKTLDEWMR